MAFDALFRRRGRSSGRNRKKFRPQEQNLILGVDYSSSPKLLEAKARAGVPLSPYAVNADLGARIGAVSKVLGYEAVIPSLGAGGILGAHYFKHTTGARFIAAWDKFLHLLSGGAGSVARTSQADWEAGTRVDVDTASSPGNVKLHKGTDFNQTTTTTSQFNGTHSNTAASSNSVILTQTQGYANDDPTSGMLTNSGFLSFNAANCVDNNTSNTAFEFNWPGKTITVDLGAGVTKEHTKFRIHSSIPPGDYGGDFVSLKIRYSDNGSSWTDASTTMTIAAPHSGWSEIAWASVGAHRYWQIYSINGQNSTGQGGMQPAREIEFYIPATVYSSSGVYTHTEQNVSGAELAKTATISFNKTTPANTAVTVDCRVYNGSSWGSWQLNVSSGATIIAAGTNLAGYKVQWRANLSTSDTGATPSLDDVTVAVTAGYVSYGEWISPVYDLGQTPMTSVLTWVQTTPANTSVSWYARGSSNGTVFGDWREILASGGEIPLQRYAQVRFELRTTDLAATPTVSSFLLSYATAYSTAYRLDLGPLGRPSGQLTGNRVRMADYEDWLLCADGERPFILYLEEGTEATGTAQTGASSAITLAAGASSVDDFYNNAFITITGGSGAGQVRFISDYNGTSKVATVSGAWKNLLTNNQASIETDTTGFTLIGSPTLTRDTNEHWHGSASLKVVTPGSVSAEGFYTVGVAASANTVYACSVYLKGSGIARIIFRDVTNNVIQNLYNITLTSTWTRYDLTLTTGALAVTDLRLGIVTNSTQAINFYADGLQIEEGAEVTDWTLSPGPNSTYSISAALKVRNLGVDPPVNAPVVADAGSAGNVTNRKYKVTLVNSDGFEGNASPLATFSGTSKQVTVNKPTGITDPTIAKWRIYGTASGASVYKYIATVNITTATYTDNTADAALGSLMLDNNNIPPDCGLIWPFNGYVFYGTEYDVWYSKVGAPDQVPNVTGDIQSIPLTGRLNDIKSNPMALLFMGDDYIAANTSNTGFVFDSDISVDTTTMKIISGSGSLSAEASDICIDAVNRENIVFASHFGLKEIIPGWQEQSLDSVPLSWDFQPYFERSINRDRSAGKYVGAKGYYLYSMQHLAPGSSEPERLTFAVDFRGKEKMIYGPWTFGFGCYAMVGADLYAGDADSGVIYRLFTGNSFVGEDIEMICDLPVLSPGGEGATHEFTEFMVVVTADSDTSETEIRPKVDDEEAVIPLGELASTFTGETRPGHNTIRSDFYDIGLPDGHALSHRIYDKSTNPLTVLSITTRGRYCRWMSRGPLARPFL
ncbi:MAG: hypothetical protein HPY50_04715 [Firmicutes bacterium]|nr:hypothetical protein [Bacillota bacterium]